MSLDEAVQAGNCRQRQFTQVRAIRSTASAGGPSGYGLQGKERAVANNSPAIGKLAEMPAGSIDLIDSQGCPVAAFWG
jgi:hypothetical protein